MSFEIVPVTQTWQHNTWVTIGLDIDADGSLNVYKASGSGGMNNPVVCYPQSDTYSAASEITKIDIPQAAGTYTMPITVWWDNSSGAHGDHNNHTITYEVIGSAPIEKSVNKVVLADGTMLIDISSDTADESHVLQGYTFHKADGTSATGTASGGGDITTEALNVTQNGTYTAPSGKAYTPVAVNVPTGGGGLPEVITAGDTPILADFSVNTAYSSSSLTNTGVSLTMPKAGTYRFRWMVHCEYVNLTVQSRLYKNNTAAGTAHSFKSPSSSSATTGFNKMESEDLACNAGDTITLYFKGASSGYLGNYGGCGMLVACIDWDIF